MEIVRAELARAMAALFVVNLRAGGTIHKLAADAFTQPRRRRKTSCGWSFGLAVSSVKVCTRVIHKSRCRKCFVRQGEDLAAQLVGDSVE